MTRRRSARPAPHRAPPRPTRGFAVRRPAAATWLAGLCLAVIVALAIVHIVSLHFLCDDAFISYRYAEHLAQGQGLVFNIGERVEGYTNFLWVLVCAALIRLGVAPETGAPWVSGAAAVVTLVAGMWFLARRRPWAAAFGFGALLAASGGFAAWATGGLETALFTLLVFAAFLALASSFAPTGSERATGRSTGSPRALIASAAFLLLAILTRPEGLLVTGMTALFLAVRALTRRLSWRALAAWAAAWGLPLAMYFAWRLLYFGHALPNTFAVKTGGVHLLPAGFSYLGQFALRQYLWLWPLPALALLAARRGLGLLASTWLLGLTWMVPYAIYVVVVGGDFMDMGRFVVPMLPVAALLAGAAWGELATWLAERWPGPLAYAPGMALLIACTALNAATTRDSLRPWHRGVDSIGLSRRYAEDWTLAARLINQIAQPTDSIAISAAGIIPYYTRLYTIDQLGLVAHDLSGYRPRSAAKMPGHGLIASADLLLKLRPQFLLGHPVVVDSVSKMNASLVLESGSVPRVMEVYRVVASQPSIDPPRYLALAVRKDVLVARRLAAPSPAAVTAPR